MATRTYMGKNEKWVCATVAADGTDSSEIINAGAFSRFSLQVAHASHDDTSTWQVYVSNDGTNYDTLSGATKTSSGASGSNSVNGFIDFEYMKITVTESDGNAASTLVPTFILKR